ncbi:MAG: cytochrome c [Casimicrobiaceae bacterium]|nr:cytochrome c [Casimicrobiaceae bacterium]MCX8098097.1 cytochrome c [Casimicrobiaceae bacterium]MDW8311635.1 cytochrome c [Burkholderiales bacterium]
MSTRASFLICVFVSFLAAAAHTPVRASDPQLAAQLSAGERLYKEHCAMCHGDDGQRGAGFPRPIWGKGHDLAKFANAKGLFEYLQMLMPFDNPAKMNDEEKWAVTAFMLQKNQGPLRERLHAGNSGSLAIR